MPYRVAAGDQSKIASAKHASRADGAHACRGLGVQLARKYICETAPVGRRPHRLTIVIAFEGEVPARESGFIGEILEPALQELDAAVIGLGDDLLPAQ